MRAKRLLVKARRTKWGRAVFMLLLHLLALIGVFIMTPYYLGYSMNGKTLGLAVFLYFLIGLSVTSGYHRLFSHGAYQAHPLVKWFFAIFGAGALEGDVETWCWSHRDHHKYTDGYRDPYCFPKGFWHAHMLWILRKRNHWWRKESEVSDLRACPIVQWQKRNWLWVGLLVSFGLPTAVAGLWGDALGGFLIAGCLRQVVIYHTTWSVNSFAHWIGSQPFPTNISPRNSWWVALLTLGEGYHANHHQYPTEYRNAFRWWQYDPSKWLVRLLAWTGIAWSLTKMPDQVIRQAMRKEA